jgi:7-keto-8-aminopelargonate synthetase-like enzyme
MDISLRLLAAGIHVQPVIFPAVPRSESLLRFFITADHTSEQIQFTIETLAQAIRDSERTTPKA